MGRGGEEPATVCDPGSELRLGGREKRRAKIINGMEKKKGEKKGSGIVAADITEALPLFFYATNTNNHCEQHN